MEIILGVCIATWQPPLRPGVQIEPQLMIGELLQPDANQGRRVTLAGCRRGLDGSKLLCWPPNSKGWLSIRDRRP